MNSYIDIRENRVSANDSLRRGFSALKEGAALSVCAVYNLFAIILSFFSETIVRVCIKGATSCFAIYFIIGNAGAFESGEVSFTTALIKSIIALCAVIVTFRLFKGD